MVTNSGDWGNGSTGMTYHYYYNGQAKNMIETRNGSNEALTQHVWGVTYVDELLRIDINDNPASDDDCLDYYYYALQDANFNVLGLVDWYGDLVERYEYTPYGQRTIYKSAGSEDDLCMAPILESQRVTADGSPAAYGICDIGHQGLMHDKEFGLIYNRARYLSPKLGRFLQRDPKGYVDGMNLYEYVRSRPVGRLDPNGRAMIMSTWPDFMDEYREQEARRQEAALQELEWQGMQERARRDQEWRELLAKELGAFWGAKRRDARIRLLGMGDGMFNLTLTGSGLSGGTIYCVSSEEVALLVDGFLGAAESMRLTEDLGPLLVPAYDAAGTFSPYSPIDLPELKPWEGYSWKGEAVPVTRNTDVIDAIYAELDIDSNHIEIGAGLLKVDGKGKIAGGHVTGSMKGGIAYGRAGAHAKGFFDAGASADVALSAIELQGRATGRAFGYEHGAHVGLDSKTIGAGADATWGSGGRIGASAIASAAEVRPQAAFVLFDRKFGAEVRARSGMGLGASVGTRTGIDFTVFGIYFLLGEKVD